MFLNETKCIELEAIYLRFKLSLKRDLLHTSATSLERMHIKYKLSQSFRNCTTLEKPPKGQMGTVSIAPTDLPLCSSALFVLLLLETFYN